MLRQSRSNALSLAERVPIRNTSVDGILSQVRISQAYEALTGAKPRRVGPDRFRGPAVWRGGDNPEAIALDDSKNTFFDHVEASGGGIIALVVRARGGTNQDALRWLAGYAGVELENKPLTNAERAAISVQRRRIEQLLPTARMWRRVAVLMTETVLDEAKSSFFGPDEPKADAYDLRALTKQLDYLRRIDGPELIDEFQYWQDRHPDLTSAMVHSAIVRAAADRRALEAYLAMAEEA